MSMRHSASHARTVLRWDHDGWTEAPDELSLEQPLEIRVRGRAVSVTMRTPGHDAELAAGFLLSEGVIRRAADLEGIHHCGSSARCNVVDVVPAPEVALDLERLTRHVFASSSCGLCGKATIEAIGTLFNPVDSGVRIGPTTLSRLPEMMRDTQPMFTRTGGLHAAALFAADGRLLVSREDVGRHNAVDKAIGYALLKGLMPLDQHVLLVSGRCSFEIMQKALAARLPIVAAVSAPSSLAVEFAEHNNQTLIGFLRGERMNVYAHAERLKACMPASGLASSVLASRP